MPGDFFSGGFFPPKVTGMQAGQAGGNQVSGLIPSH
jgi:hypothetical protein